MKRTKKVPLDDLSTDIDSSWRDIDQEEVTRLEMVIVDLEYGTTTLSMNAQVVCDSDGTAEKAQDGREKLANGKRMTQALKNKQKERKAILVKQGSGVGPDSDSGYVPAWCNQPVLVDVFVNGHLGGLNHIFNGLLGCLFAWLLVCLFACLLARLLASLLALYNFLIASVYTGA